MSKLPNCPQCDSEYTYEDGQLFVCPMCAHEWTQEDEVARAEAGIIRDANGNQLENGDSVTVIKDLKLSQLMVTTLHVRLMALVAFISNQFTSRNN